MVAALDQPVDQPIDTAREGEPEPDFEEGDETVEGLRHRLGRADVGQVECDDQPLGHGWRQQAGRGYHWGMSDSRIEARRYRGRKAAARGTGAEALAAAALEATGWVVRARRMRTAAGEIDIIAEKEGMLAFIEVKARPRLADAAAALSPRQRARLLRAAELVLAAHPDWGRQGVRFDVLVVDAEGRARRISDAFREE